MQRLVTTYLALEGADALRPAREADDAVVELVRPPDGLLNRRLYATVGAPWRWTDHLGKDDAWWRDHAAGCETWTLHAGGALAGYAELGRPGEGGVELQYFGLLPAFHGRGLGGHLLTVVLRRGLELAPRVWVSTCTWDGPHAQANYEARGMRPFRRVVR